METELADRSCLNGTAGPSFSCWGLVDTQVARRAARFVSPADTLATRGADHEELARFLETQGDSEYHSGRHEAAASHFREALEARPDDASLRFKLACAAWAIGDLAVVEREFRGIVDVHPRHARAHEALARLYLFTDRLPEALAHGRAALSLAPQDRDVITTCASALQRNGLTEEAWRIFQPLADDPNLADGRAIELFARLAPQVNRAPQALDRIADRLAAPEASPAERLQLHFAAVELLDREGRYDEAFEHARRGQLLRPRPHDVAAHAASVSTHIRHCTSRRMRSLPRALHSTRRPVFIVGMPRSGTSLVEQILASHPQVYGGGELPHLARLSRVATDHPAGWLADPHALDALSLNTINDLSAQYLACLSALNDTATYVTDKLPHNFLYLDLIALLFPECHVIHCVRDPLDTCASCYLTNFADGSEFARDLSHLAAFHRQYERLMRHWKRTLRIPILNVQYEQIVDDLEGQCRRLLDFLGLPWDERCLQFHTTRRVVGTASRDQVRRPLYKSSIGRWRNYRKHLGPLLPDSSTEITRKSSFDPSPEPTAFGAAGAGS
ncbi:MAG TPA: sulfotransferase [Tepidisphaeraceae bacterium]|nr:sulfotransferase [Tepidisphaeraceae bacterium]